LAPLTRNTLLTAGKAGARSVVIGGQLLGRQLMWWNFVYTSKERIEEDARA
jgi:redox-sensitive bicupin YhaK (pirin superfamily)